MKFGSLFGNLLGIKCMKLDLDLFRFAIFIAQYLGISYLPDTV